MSVTVRNKLPKGDRNGLAALEAQLADEPDGWVTVVALMRPDSVENKLHDDDDPRVVKLTIGALEPIEAGPDSLAAERMMRDRYAARTGRMTLPFEDPEPDDGDKPGGSD